MMTMAISMADDNPPWCHNTINCIAMAFPTLRESIALKVGTRGNDSQKNHHLTALHRIPTRISPSSPPANVVNCHEDDDK